MCASAFAWMFPAPGMGSRKVSVSAAAAPHSAGSMRAAAGTAVGGQGGPWLGPPLRGPRTLNTPGYFLEASAPTGSLPGPTVSLPGPRGPPSLCSLWRTGRARCPAVPHGGLGQLSATVPTPEVPVCQVKGKVGTRPSRSPCSLLSVPTHRGSDRRTSRPGADPASRPPHLFLSH